MCTLTIISSHRIARQLVNAGEKSGFYFMKLLLSFPRNCTKAIINTPCIVGGIKGI